VARRTRFLVDLRHDQLSAANILFLPGHFSAFAVTFPQWEDLWTVLSSFCDSGHGAAA